MSNESHPFSCLPHLLTPKGHGKIERPRALDDGFVMMLGVSASVILAQVPEICGGGQMDGHPVGDWISAGG